MSKLVWDQISEKLYETGVDRGVVYPQENGAYPKGAAWNGLMGVSLSPSGAEASPLYANNRKYLNLVSVEELDFTIKAYTYPDEFAACDGSGEVVPGVYVRQQKRKTFGFSYRNLIGNDTDGTAYGYRLHLIYGAIAAPSEQEDNTVNDSPEAKEMSWECKTTPIDMAGFEPTSHIEIDSTKVDAEKLKALEAILYGDGDTEARLPLPDEVATLVGWTAAEG